MTPSKIELKHQLSLRKLQLLQYSVKWLGIVLCVLFISGSFFLSIRVLAGKKTVAEMALRAYADLRANKPIALIVSYLLTSSAVGWGSLERLQRKRYIKRNHSIIEAHRRSQDARRGTSGLTENGETREEDE
jgi:hypothetical protein